jgi:arginyl-tRNA synthetase
MCEPPEIAGPGFINFRLKDDWLVERLINAGRDERLGIARVDKPMTYVIDYSAPNVAKPMHVGHIRSTVIGDALYRTLKFLGHRVIGDNHIGDWGTQFGMIIFGYKHFLDAAAYSAQPVEELARLYRLVNQLAGYYESLAATPGAERTLAEQQAMLAKLSQEQLGATKQEQKHQEKERRQLANRLAESRETLEELRAKMAAVESHPELFALAKQHPDIGQQVLAETAKLHAGDAENRRLWEEFLPPCLEALDVAYRRLGVTFDHAYGESFYHDRLAGVVEDLKARGLAQVSEGAVCVFLEGHDTPMLIQKQDGAYLYGTTDLATIQYRLETWRPDVILYVVDHRQSLHFVHLFATAKKWICRDTQLVHVSFGTVMGEDKRPFKTRSGDTVGLLGLLDEAVRRAHQVVSDNDDAKPDGPELSPDERLAIAEPVGIGALKYADLSQNRTSDYVFSYDKMLALTGNTATYMQYAYARVRSIFRKGGIDVSALWREPTLLLGTPAERSLALSLLQLHEALASVIEDYRPNQLTAYLFALAERYSTFYHACHVLNAESAELRASRLRLCDLTARTLKQGLALLGIEVVEKM